MKHAGSREDLLGRLGFGKATDTGSPARFGGVGGQSLVSRLVCLACALLLVAIVADAPVRALARSLDPSLVSVLRFVTGFGNSAWPLGIGLTLLAMVALARRTGRIAPDALNDFRSVLVLVVGSVAISGFLASLTKNVIGRIRPSTSADAEVLEFVMMSFRAGWAAFPSGHATTATACAVALALCFPRHAWAWLSIGLLAALSRAFLGVHWLTDCLAGIFLGAVVTLQLKTWLDARGHRFALDPSVPPRVVGAALLQAVRLVGAGFAGAKRRLAGLVGRGAR